MSTVKLYPAPSAVDIGERPDNDPPVFEAVSMYKVPHALISSYGYIIRNFKLLKEGISFRHRHSVSLKNIISFTFLKKKVRIAQPCISIANGWYESYYHFTLESLPKLFLMRNELAGAVVVFPAAMSSFHRQWFSILNIRNIRTITDNEVVKTPLAITTNFSSRDLNHHNLVMPEFRDWVVSHLNNTGPAGPEKIFVGRKAARYRILLNSEETKTLLAANGFVYVEMEDLSVEQQIRMFNGASRIVCVHGAALSNTCFCKPGTRIIDLMHEDFKQWCFLKLAKVLDLEYTILPCEGPNDGDQLPGHRNITANLQQLSQTIEKW